MKTKKVINEARKFAKPFRITNGQKFRFKDFDPSETMGLKSEDKPRAKEALETGIGVLAELQDMLYAQDKWAVLLIFQALDAAGKDGAIKHVMSGVNPQGCQVFSFKSPSAEDLDHDYLWRCMKCLPNRGHIGIFNHSYYEETLVVRVHPEFLATQKIPSFEERTEAPLPRTRGYSCKKLEVFRLGYGGTRLLGSKKSHPSTPL